MSQKVAILCLAEKQSHVFTDVINQRLFFLNSWSFWVPLTFFRLFRKKKIADERHRLPTRAALLASCFLMDHVVLCMFDGDKLTGTTLSPSSCNLQLVVSSSRCDLPWSATCTTYIATVILFLSLKLFSRLECLSQRNTRHPGPHGHPPPRSLAQQQGNKGSTGANFFPLRAVNITEPTIFSCKI